MIRNLEIPPFDRLRVVTVRLCSLSLSKVEGNKAEPPKAGAVFLFNLTCSFNQIVNTFSRGNKSKEYEDHHQIGGSTQLFVQEISDVVSQYGSHRHKHGDGGQNTDLTVSRILIILFFVHAVRVLIFSSIAHLFVKQSLLQKVFYYNISRQSSQAFLQPLQMCVYGKGKG